MLLNFWQKADGSTRQSDGIGQMLPTICVLASEFMSPSLMI